MKHNVLGNSIFITICLSFFNSVYGQNCEERTLKKLESVYRSNLAQYKRIVRKTIQRSDEYRDSIDVAKPGLGCDLYFDITLYKKNKERRKKRYYRQKSFFVLFKPKQVGIG